MALTHDRPHLKRAVQGIAFAGAAFVAYAGISGGGIGAPSAEAAGLAASNSSLNTRNINTVPGIRADGCSVSFEPKLPVVNSGPIRGSLSATINRLINLKENGVVTRDVTSEFAQGGNFNWRSPDGKDLGPVNSIDHIDMDIGLSSGQYVAPDIHDGQMMRARLINNVRQLSAEAAHLNENHYPDGSHSFDMADATMEVTGEPGLGTISVEDACGDIVEKSYTEKYVWLFAGEARRRFPHPILIAADCNTEAYLTVTEAVIVPEVKTPAQSQPKPASQPTPVIPSNLHTPTGDGSTDDGANLENNSHVTPWLPGEPLFPPASGSREPVVPQP